MTNFIESQNAVTEFFDVLKKNSGKSEIKNAWNAKLAENGVTITDKTFELPRKLVESINTALLNTNPVFKVFHVTNVGALLVSRSLIHQMKHKSTKTDNKKQSRQLHSLLTLLNL